MDWKKVPQHIYLGGNQTEGMENGKERNNNIIAATAMARANFFARQLYPTHIAVKFLSITLSSILYLYFPVCCASKDAAGVVRLFFFITSRAISSP